MSNKKSVTFPRNRKVQSAIILLMIHLEKPVVFYDSFIVDLIAAGHRDIQDILWTELGYNIKYTTYINAIEHSEIYRPSALMFQSHFRAVESTNLKEAFAKFTK
mgnify:CR=1 FL=1